MMTVLLLFLLSFLASLVVVRHYGIHLLTEPAVCCLWGAAASAILYANAGDDAGRLDAIESLDFSPAFFNFVLLPVIIFDEGFHMRPLYFVHQLGTILLYAVVGGIISTVFIGAVLYVMGERQPDVLGVQLGLAESLAFASLISSTDPDVLREVYRSPPWSVST